MSPIKSEGFAQPRGRAMKLTVVLAVLIGILVVACSTAAPAPAEPTPNIDATVEARAKELVAAQTTPTPAMVVKEAVPIPPSIK